MRLTFLIITSLSACTPFDIIPYPTRTFDANADDCSTATVDTFVVGLEKMGAAGTIDFKLISVDPTPPGRGDNTWIVQINAMSAGVIGSPIDGASMTAVPFMPTHKHGSPIGAIVSPMPDAGRYKLSPVNPWMPGLWETTITVASGGNDSAVYRFCIP